MHIRTAPAVIIAAFLVAACGDTDGDRAETVPTRAPSATSTQSQASVDTPEAADATPTNTPEPTQEPEALAQERIDAALMSLDDMPAGWSPGVGDEDEGDDDGLQLCGDTSPRPADEFSAVAGAQAEFQQAELGPYYFQSIAAFEGDLAAQAMEFFRELMADCPDWEETDEDGTTLAYSVSPMSFGTYGDETFALRITASGVPLFGSLQADMALIRYGRFVAYQGYVFLGSAGDFSLTTMVELADQKAREALR